MFGKYKKLHNLAAVTGLGLQNYFTFYFEAEKIGNLSPPPHPPPPPTSYLDTFYGEAQQSNMSDLGLVSAETSISCPPLGWDI